MTTTRPKAVIRVLVPDTQTASRAVQCIWMWADFLINSTYSLEVPDRKVNINRNMSQWSARIKRDRERENTAAHRILFCHIHLMMAASNGPTLWQSSHGKVWRDFIRRQEEKCSHRTEDKLWLPVFAGSLISPRFLLPPSSHVIYMSRFVLQLPSFSIIAIVSFLCVFSVYLVDLDLSFFPLRLLGIKLSTIAIVLCL